MDLLAEVGAGAAVGHRVLEQHCQHLLLCREESYGEGKKEEKAEKVQLGRSSPAIHGGAYFSAVCA